MTLASFAVAASFQHEAGKVVITRLAELRWVGEVHMESTLVSSGHAETTIQQVVPSWWGWQREQAAIAAAVQKYDELTALSDRALQPPPSDE